MIKNVSSMSWESTENRRKKTIISRAHLGGSANDHTVARGKEREGGKKRDGRKSLRNFSRCARIYVRNAWRALISRRIKKNRNNWVYRILRKLRQKFVLFFFGILGKQGKFARHRNQPRTLIVFSIPKNISFLSSSTHTSRLRTFAPLTPSVPRTRRRVSVFCLFPLLVYRSWRVWNRLCDSSSIVAPRSCYDILAPAIARGT